MKENHDLPQLTAAEREQSIQLILEQGLKRPRTLSGALLALWRALGPRLLFCGVGDCLFLSVLLATLLWLLIFTKAQQSADSLYGPLFLASPLLYALLQLLILWKEVLNGTYEQLMVCRYNLRQLGALRMLIFGALSTAILAALTGGYWLYLGRDASILRMLAVACSALFVYAAITLACQLYHPPRPVLAAAPPVLWGALGMLLVHLGSQAGPLLAKVPTLVFLLVAAAALVAYLSLLRQYYFSLTEGALAYAIG